MQKILLIGNLTRDPELRTTPTGVNVCEFSIAVNRRFGRNQQGDNAQPETDFYRITAWRQLGENCKNYLAKGRKVYVSGQLNARTYVANDGTTRVSLDVTADEVEFLSSRNEGQSYGAASASIPAAEPAAAAQQAVPQSQVPAGFTSVENDDLPF